MPVFIKLKEKDRIRLFNLIKKNINSSWEIFYPQFNISRSMFFNYLSGKYDIPKNIFLKLEKIGGIKIKNYKQSHKNKYMEKDLIKPKMNSHLAESLGVLNGDGHISQISHEICVVGNALEKDYHIYLKKLFENVFNLRFKLEPQDTKIKLRGYSKRLANHLNEEYEIPKGNKLGKLKIPKQIFDSKTWLAPYIRGLFDTDGSFFKRRKRDLVIEIISADENFLKEIKKAFNLLGFNAGMSGKHVYLYRKEEIEKFFKTIKPANSKHLKKFKLYSNL